MQKKLLIITACMIAVLVIVGIAVTNRASEESRQVEQILQDDSEEETALVSLEEVRKEADAVIEAGRNGEYRNLQFDEICPLITEEDRIYQIQVSPREVPVTEENLQKVLDMMQTLLEEPIDEKLVTAVMSNDLGYISIDELREGIRKRDKEYTEMGYYLFYLNEEEDLCAQINSNMNSVWIDRGLEGTGPSGEDLLNLVYYPGAADGSLQDVYETAGGEMSVEEAIEQVENYFNHELPVSISGEMECRVARVYVLKMPDGTYGFDFAMRRSYGGVLFESANSPTYAYEMNEVVDLSEAVLDGESHVLFFNGYKGDRSIEKIQEISAVVPLERATEYISRKIGNNTVYTVKGIELSYVGKYVEKEDGNRSEKMIPAWMFTTVNETNGKEVRFYVDAITGEVSQRTM